ncbi:MAG: aminomethyl-transferring glycine dehydrogenase subunit GcvPA [Candidatus Omnitrophica bacterium]|nr:aminomethyl-transferring glycine dehydrogenase subunit GcvPA [Candidatus Omnitrophota bacterium]
MSYFPLTAEDRQAMLDVIGVEHFGLILQSIPASLRNPSIRIPESLSEYEIRTLFSQIAAENAHVGKMVSFLGAGAYEHYIPSVVNTIISRSEFYTAYTPYQPEASQGTLQALFEYQSMMCELTGMPVSNGSHYDGATALAEAALLSLNKTRRTKVLVTRSLHPELRKVLDTYLAKTGMESVEIPFLKDSSLDQNALREKLTVDVGAIIIQSPNFFGSVEDLSGIAELAHQNGSLFIMVSNPLSFGFYKTPVEWGADIACGEGQPLGIPLSFGGPWLGFLTTTRELMRQIPGRLVGLTKDSEGNRAFCLTLQAREQHIRRERANSNICTNQALCAIAAAVYLTCMGKQGIRQVAELNMENAYYLRDEIAKLTNFQVVTQASIFNEFAIRCPRPVSEINQFLLKKGILGGFDIASVFPEFQNAMLLCATETKSKEDLDRFVAALKESVDQ